MVRTRGKGRGKTLPLKTKRCSRCGLVQTLKHFHKRDDSADGYRGQCIKCLSNAGKNASDRRRHLKKFFGLTPEHYDLMLAKQGACCAICHGVNDNGHRLSVDHCHKTNKVRGLLCSECNHGLGRFQDDIPRLKAAINYLKENQ